MDISVLEVLQLPFMARAFVTIAVLSVAAGIVGLGISFREIEFVSDGLVHAVFPGLVIGAAIGGSAGLLPGAMVAALAAAVVFTLLDRRGGAGSDAAIAVGLTALFSLGVVLVSKQQGYVAQLQDLLFGHLLTVTQAQLWQIVVVAALAVAIMALTGRAQIFRAFDPAGFEAAGFRILRTDLALAVATALLVVAGVQALGVLMVVALLTVPMAVARLSTRRPVWLVPIAIVVPLVAGTLGLWWSFVWSVNHGLSVSPGALIVLMFVAMYLLAVGARYAFRGRGSRPRQRGRSSSARVSAAALVSGASAGRERP